MNQHETPEQKARDMLERMGIDRAQSFTSGDVVELANMIAVHDQLVAALKLARGHADTDGLHIGGKQYLDTIIDEALAAAGAA